MEKKKPREWFGYLLLFIPLIVFFLFDYKENDIWFILSHGKYVLSNGFPHIEFLSMHDGLHFIMQQWLSSITFYGVFNIFGFLGLYLFVLLMLIIIIFLIFKLCLIISNNKVFISGFITASIGTLLSIGYITPRPQIFTYIILILLLIIMELYIKNKKDILFLIPILSILQINFHASMWPVFFIILMPFVAQLLVELIQHKNKKIIKLFIFIFISILVGIINPYGIENMLYGINSYGNTYINKVVSEMRSINVSIDSESFKQSILLLGLFFIITITMIFKNKKKTEIHEILLIYGTFFMALLNLRNYGLFYICSLPFLTKYINIKDNKTYNIPKLLYISFIVVIVILLTVNIYNKKYIIHNDNEKLVDYLNKNENKKKKIFTYYDDGGFFEYNGYKAYIDSRAEIFTKKINKKEDIFTEYYEFDDDEDLCFESFDKKYKFDYYVVYNFKTDLIKQLENNNFERVVSSKGRYLYKRK